MDHIAPGGLPLDHVGVGTVSPSRRQFLQTTLAVAAAGGAARRCRRPGLRRNRSA